MSLDADLARELRGARLVAVVGVGDELEPHDRDGLRAARDVDALRLPRVRVVEGGAMPENVTGTLRRLAPSHVVLVDAARMGRPPGEAVLLDAARATGQRFSTHAMPLSTLADYLRDELGARVLLVGIEPGGESGARAVRDAFAAAMEGS